MKNALFAARNVILIWLPSRYDGLYRKMIVYYDEITGDVSHMRIYHIIDGEDVLITDPNEY